MLVEFSEHYHVLLVPISCIKYIIYIYIYIVHNIYIQYTIYCIYTIHTL